MAIHTDTRLSYYGKWQCAPVHQEILILATAQFQRTDGNM